MWQEIYKSKLVTAEEAIQAIKDNDVVVTGFACGEPFGIQRALVENYKKLNEKGIGTYILFQETYHQDSYNKT